MSMDSRQLTPCGQMSTYQVGSFQGLKEEPFAEPSTFEGREAMSSGPFLSSYLCGKPLGHARAGIRPCLFVKPLLLG